MTSFSYLAEYISSSPTVFLSSSFSHLGECIYMPFANCFLVTELSPTRRVYALRQLFSCDRAFHIWESIVCSSPTVFLSSSFSHLGDYNCMLYANCFTVMDLFPFQRLYANCFPAIELFTSVFQLLNCFPAIELFTYRRV